MRHPPFRRPLASAKPKVAALIYHDVTVRYVCGGYRTSRVQGLDGSSTTSPARAAERLAQKLFGAACVDSVQRIDAGRETNVSLWRISNKAALASSQGAK